MDAKGFYYSYAWLCSSCEGKTFMHGAYLQKTLQILNYVFDWLYFTQCLTSFSFIDHLLCLYAWFFILFHITQMGFSQSTNLLLCLSLETLMSIFIDLVNFVIIFLSLMTLLRWLTFLLGSLTVTLKVLFFCISFFLLMLVFVLQSMAFSPLGNFDHVVAVFIDFLSNSQQNAPFMTILVVIGRVFLIT